MAKGNQRIIGFPSTIRRKVQARFTGGEVTSDGGVMLLRQADRRLGLTAAVSQGLNESRRTAGCKHDQLSLWRQRFLSLAHAGLVRTA